MSETKHAPLQTPLRVYHVVEADFKEDVRTEKLLEITSLDHSETYCYATSEEAAEQIVRACNAHYDLVAAAEAALSHIERYDLDSPSTHYRQTADHLRAALAKAHGSSSGQK